ncbi:hypothetical protein KCU92_g191, partial [Aureobasidium melanogenum]
MTKEILSSASTTVSISADPKVAVRYPSRVEIVYSKSPTSGNKTEAGSSHHRIEAASQSSGEDHASRRDASNLEATRSSRSEGELSAVERFMAHVEVVLRDGVERVGLATFVDAAAVDGAADHAADQLSTGAEDTVAGEAFAVEGLLGFDGGSKGHGEGNDDGGELHLD